MTALSVHLQQTTRQLFSTAVRQVCASLQSIADATLTLAVANPTLLARYLLNNTFLSARLISAHMVEVYPCISILPKEVHVNTHEMCFDKLPVTFMLYGTPHHGFLDPITQIIHPTAIEVSCETHKVIYIPAGPNRLQKVNQLTGDIRYVDEPESFRLMRFGEIDFPDHQEIMKLTKPSTVWLDNPSSRAEAFANRVVSTGLFSFLKGGMVSLAQLWTFLCCVYVSLIAISQFVLPPQIGQIIRLFNIAVPIVWAYEKASKRIRERRARGEQQRATADEPPVEALPLAERWPSDRALEPVRVAAIDKRNFRMSCFINSKPAVVLADTGASVSICDKDCARKFKMTNYLPPTIPGIIGIGQEILTPVGRAEIGLEIAGYRSNASVHVFDREIGEGNYDMILGFDEIKKLPFYFDFKRAQLVPMATLTDIPDRKISKWPIQTLVVEIDLSESNWSEEDLSSLKDLVNQNVDVFSNHEYDFGLCTIKAPPIRTTTQEPITGRPYRVPDKYRDELDSHIQKMLKADASQVSFAGGLFQMAKDSDKLHAVSYCSRTTTATEQRLPATHAELGAIVYALSVFKPTIYQCDLTIHTDHRPLTYLFHKASTNAKLNRWLLAIQDISPKIAYVEGKANRVADALSRVAIPWTKVQENPIPEEVPYLLLADVILPITLESVKSETSKDQTLKSVMDNIRSEWEVPSEEHLESYHRIRNALTIRNGVIYKDATRIVIPKALQNPVLCILHRTHMGTGVAVETAVRLWLQDFRATPNTVTNESPASRFLGREIRTPSMPCDGIQKRQRPPRKVQRHSMWVKPCGSEIIVWEPKINGKSG
ncbi:retrovirus-related Pol polyprotein from transposon [Ditylenchus destructor]|uniref:Retrovirus-related Pol polyprotein from transposon n=1 Tax=Ditylenchus destructor TaxID=166010 RepID=A0AAD4R4Q7_9BILA|nr:retrovirus-related Pol polyprotein from transposon [Ditylenchus destructor]